MLIVAFKPGHDGGMAAIADSRLLYSLESEKDSFARYSFLTPATVLEIAERLDALPDVVAVGGWQEKGIDIRGEVGAGYRGTDLGIVRSGRFFGKDVTFFSSSHERSHILGSIGMAPPGRHRRQAVLVWEGITGSFFLVDDTYRVVRRVDVMDQPGAKYAALFAILDPGFPADGGYPRLSDAGKLMALAAHADAHGADAEIRTAVGRVLAIGDAYPVPKNDFRDTVLFDAGVTSQVGVLAAAVITERIFTLFAEAAVRALPAGVPLRISGGCGLNCDWNQQWRDLGYFSDVFVPPCPNDSGSAIGTAIDAQATLTGAHHIDWDVYSGLEFVTDTTPDRSRWHRRNLDHRAVAEALAAARVFAWVQGRWEIGPRALGNRSLLADAQSSVSKDRLNHIKRREDYRPIAPAARIEDLASAFDTDFEDPYMLYFRRVRDRRLAAVTHVDGSARVQTVSRHTNPVLHQLLDAVAERQGLGVVCNTSLNFNGHGFINRMSDLVAYCESRGITDMVVGRDWYTDTCARTVDDGSPGVGYAPDIVERRDRCPTDPAAARARTATTTHGKDGTDLSTPDTPRIFACPVCGEPLDRDHGSFTCINAHRFDIAREGYLNLHLARYRRSKDPGYSKEMIAGRRDFFDAGHYQSLADAVAELIASYLPATGPAVVVDAGCGEGYYLRRLRRLLAETGREHSAVLVGMDISKHGVRVASKRDRTGLYAVAGTYRMPILSGTVDVLLTHFSPVSAGDFRRVVKPAGVVLVGGPGEDHLYSFKELLYDIPARHEPADLLADEPGFEPIAVHRIRYPLHLHGPGQVANLLLMTPFYWSVDDATRTRLAEMTDLHTEVDVTMRAYRRSDTTTDSALTADEPNDEGDLEDW